MSNRFFILFVFRLTIALLPCVGMAQGYSILPDAMCWSISGADSSIVRLVLASTTASQPGFVRYVDLSGQAVNVTGGTLSYGYCCCNGGGGGGTVRYAREALTPYLRGIDVRTVGNIDSVGLDIAGLTILNPSGDAGIWIPVWDSLNNVNVRVPASYFSGGGGGSTATAGSGLTNTGTLTNAVIRLGGTLTTGATIAANGFTTEWNSGSGGFTGNLFRIGDTSGSEIVSLFNQKYFFNATEAQLQTTTGANITSTLFAQDNAGISIQGTNTFTGRAFFMYQNGSGWEMFTDSTSGVGLVDSYRFDFTPTGIALSHSNVGATNVKSMYVTDQEVGFLVNDGTNTGVSVTTKTVVFTGIPTYANDAAADADATLPSGGAYTVTGDRSLRIKP